MSLEVVEPSGRALRALRIERVVAETRDAVVVTFAVPPEFRATYRFTQGQFLTLEAEVDGETLRRSYSICSSPLDGELRVAIKRVADGRFSAWAHAALVPGATLLVGPPEGRFHVPLDAANVRHYLAVAAGSGITPILSLIATTLRTEPLARFTLVYGNRATSSVMFRNELADLKDRYVDRLVLLYVMSREPQDVELFSGRIDRAKFDALLEGWIDATRVDVAFLCGPQAMTQAVIESLAAHGLAAAKIKTELFSAAPRSAGHPRSTASTQNDAAYCRASALVDGHRRTFSILKGGETVLDAGLRQGIDLPYSCRGGVCSTCRAVLVAGEVDMDVHYALEDYEIARGFVLLCQSYPVTDTLEIDVDAHSHV